MTAIVPLTPAAVPAAAELVARAFRDEPFLVYAVPEPETRVRLTAHLCVAVLRAYLPHGGVLVTAGAMEGVAACLPPGAEVTDEDLMAAGFGDAVAEWGEAAFAPVAGLLGEMATVRERTMPGPHWYCLVFAVEPARQRQGIGGRLMRAIATRADAAGVPVYLETDVEANVEYYARHGFAVAATWAVASLNDAPCWALRRDPQT